jgi:DNA-directed RNA polymerase subunit omega
MLAPNDIEELKGENSRYAVVVGVAKRARQIADEAEANKEIIIEKPVSLAIQDFRNGDCSLFVSEDI